MKDKVIQNDKKDIPHYAISSLPELLGDIVSLVDNEVLVENFEDFAALEVCHLVTVSSIRTQGLSRWQENKMIGRQRKN